ncbi:MAG: phosphoribosyl-AMP cyclohydrolase [bacterium]|nr:phosphoribosyl-AMP cyclohydrolase [bacterium]
MKLIPTIIQDAITREVYMLGFMNDKALALTKQTGYVHFWSRKRKKLWKKGEISGNTLLVKKIDVDCDNDTFLIQVKLLGTVVCHTGKRTCFASN